MVDIRNDFVDPTYIIDYPRRVTSVLALNSNGGAYISSKEISKLSVHVRRAEPSE